MRVNLMIVAGLVLALCGLGTAGCKKSKGTEEAKLDPHSSDGIMAGLQEQAKLFNDAVEQKDFKYLHDYGFYFIDVIGAFNSKLNAGEQQRLKPLLQELATLGQQLDSAGGGRHAEAAAATVQRVQVVLKDLEQQYQQGKPPR